MQYFHRSEKGISHNKNQDSYIFRSLDDYTIFAVADGVGGLSHGEIASSIALKPFSKMNLSSSMISSNTLYEDANQLILSESEKINRLIASTLVITVIDKNTRKITISHIGDSRAYIINKGNIWHTKDHTLVRELVDLGIISEEQAFHHPNKNRLNKALGISEIIEVDTFSTNLSDQSIIMLCTDGLHDFVQGDEIKEIINKEQPNTAIDHLIAKARENGSTDDITIIIASDC